MVGWFFVLFDWCESFNNSFYNILIFLIGFIILMNYLENIILLWYICIVYYLFCIFVYLLYDELRDML